MQRRSNRLAEPSHVLSPSDQLLRSAEVFLGQSSAVDLPRLI